ncbi:MAG TPA: SIMPL domain-containing protein [Ilumatobacteraceae bacterium]|nr:SIMPL domain-containing protein [Ilumatobacteraceae bacterium]
MKRTITVVGVGAVTAAPDIATVNVGVQVQAANAQDALRRANELTTAVLDAVRDLGMADNDLRTNGPHLWPNDRGYQCGNDVSVVVRDVSRTGSVIDVAAGAGGPSFTISGVSFGVADPVAMQTRARRAAMENALAVATELASAAGAAVGEVVTIVEGAAGGPPRPMPMAEMRMAQVATPVATGEQTVKVDVSVTYRLVDAVGKAAERG